MMIKVKICGMCNSGNVREVAETGPDFMGFIFYPGSKRYIGESPDKSLLQQVPPGIQKTGVFVNQNIDIVLALSKKFVLDVIQLHGSEAPDYCSIVQSSGYKVIKTFGVDRDFDFNGLNPYLSTCDYFLFDTKTENYGGTGIKFNWDKIKDYHLDKPFFLSGGIGPEDIQTIKNISHKEFIAVDINSRFETIPGIKNTASVNSFIKELKTIK
jgi:phosphoribosylanthranilate isomerase